jgi:alkylation response protein AidB-like acyl-CoA dehydrogenase
MTDQIDTSKMSKGKADALEAAEAARDGGKEGVKSFSGGLFTGEANYDLIYPFPKQSEEDKAKGDGFLEQLNEVLDKHVDADAIDREGEIPDKVFEELAKIGAFAIKIPTEYGGRGLSQTNYSRAAMKLGEVCGNITALVSAHQSIGVPQPLLLFGTDEQKKKHLPRFGKGEISAFALTEETVGSDPAQMTVYAELSEDKSHYVLNGEKLWCTNGVKASVIIVMARTPDTEIKGKMRKSISAFIVDMDMPGVEVVTRCHFMGLKALYNGVVRFTDVKIPTENLVAGEGKGLKVALSTLNTGRLTLPAACVGLMRSCLKISREWSATREQWGCVIGKHQAIADKIAKIAAKSFATESIVLFTSSLVDGKKADIRVESAMCKMWGTEEAWKVADETMQIRGGRGYETADSLKNRGMEPIPVERYLRDCRINLIFEGSSEIMRLLLAREALDPHLKAAGAVLNSRLPLMVRLKAAIGAGLFYARWYPKQWLPTFNSGPRGCSSSVGKYLRFVAKTSKKLSRKLFHSMLRYGPALDKQQMLLGRLTEIGTELFVISACAIRIDSMIKDNPENTSEYLELMDVVFSESKIKIKNNFSGMSNNNDKKNYSFAKKILGGTFKFLE